MHVCGLSQFQEQQVYVQGLKTLETIVAVKFKKVVTKVGFYVKLHYSSVPY